MLRLARFLTIAAMLAPAIATSVAATPAVAQVTGGLTPAALAPAALASPALAATPVLKRDVTVSSELVRIGDLIENAGTSARVPIFRAPDLGQTGTVSAARVVEALRQHGFTIVETHGVAEVAVTRLSRVIGVKEIQLRIAQALSGEPGLGDPKDLIVTLDRDARSVQLEPSSGELQPSRQYYDPRTGRFDVTFDVSGSAAARRAPLRYSGTVVETVAAAVLTRPLNRGDLIKAADVTIERRPKAEVHGNVPSTADAMIGMATRRALRAGDLLHAADLTKPEIVQRNETVTLVYEAPGLMLTVRGKAVESGAQGDTVSVVNVQSKRTVQGIVSGPGQVAVAVATPRVITQNTSQPAAEAPHSE